jgi:N6-adenosine-specific RNA methylase IME4
MITINERFRKLIPPLSPDEYAGLEASLLADGCRDAIVLWHDQIVDGHNRYEICSKHGIMFNTAYMEFANEDDACIWMIANQIGRRNINDGQKWQLIEEKKRILLERGREKQACGQGGVLLLSEYDKSKPHNTQKEIASDLGWSTGKVAKADYVWKKAPETVKQEILSGEKSFDRAYQEVKKEERKAEIERQKIEIISLPPKPFNGKYEVLVVDPPWAYGREYDPETSRVANPYPEMSQDELLAISLPASDNSILFLWTTHAFIFDAKELMDAWGFTHKAILVWDKEKIGMGHWFRMQCEFCLVGIKGKPYFSNTTWRDIIREPRREHSRKPEIFYEMVESVARGSKIDYFSREARQGWDCYGNDTNKF